MRVSLHITAWAFALLVTPGVLGGDPEKKSSASEWPRGVLAFVNDKSITESDVRAAMSVDEEWLRRGLANRPEELQRRLEQLKKEALEKLIDCEVIVAEFSRRELEIPGIERMVNERLEIQIRERSKGDTNLIVQELAKHGQALTKRREALRDELIVSAMEATALGNFPVPTRERVAQYYQEHQDQFRRAEQVELWLISIPKKPSGQTVTVESQRELSEKIRARISAAADFASEAKSYSQQPSTTNAGYYGWMERNSLNERIADAVFALKPGELSKVIESDTLFSLARVTDRRPARLAALSEVQDEIEKALRQAERTAARNRWLQELRSKAVIRMAP